MEQVILVDKNDNEIGLEEKIAAHLRGGKLHRAFSIFIFNSSGQLMLQKRAKGKYHAGGLWSNACCGHPRPNEKTGASAVRRLKEEMGFDCVLNEKSNFIYKVSFGNNITEHEFLHIFIGNFDGLPALNPEEVEDWKWVDVESLKIDMEKNSQKYTPWFIISLQLVLKMIEKNEG